MKNGKFDKKDNWAVIALAGDHELALNDEALIGTADDPNTAWDVAMQKAEDMKPYDLRKEGDRIIAHWKNLDENGATLSYGVVIFVIQANHHYSRREVAP